MFQSSHVSDTQLLEALAWEYFPGLMGLTLSLFEDPVEARPVCQETLALAVVNRHRYWGEASVKVWLYSLATRLCRQASLKRKLRRLLPRRKPFQPAGRMPLSAPFPAQDLTADLAEIEARIARLRARGRVSIPAREIVTATSAILLIVLLAWAGKLLPGRTVNSDRENAPNPTRHPTITPPPPSKGVFFFATADPRDLLSRPTPVTPAPPLPVVKASWPIKDIIQRIQQSSQAWHTLWVDAMIVDYGPVDYLGPPQLYRNQLWASKPDKTLILAGPYRGPDYLRIVLGNDFYEMDLKSSVAIYPENADILKQARASSLILQYAQNWAGRNRLYGFYLAHLLFPPASLFQAGDLRLVGKGEALGRETLVLDHTSGSRREDRLWMDPPTGLILRWQKFDPNKDQLVLQDVVVTGIRIDIDFPYGFFRYQPSIKPMAWGDLYQPERGAAPAPPLDVQLAARARLPIQSTGPAEPPGDISQEPLTFQWESNPGSGEVASQEADLFAGKAYLGRITMGDPWVLQCSRSPDGKLVGFISNPGGPFLSGHGLRWFRITDPAHTYDPFPEGLTGSNLAFSPDSRRLAFFGCKVGERVCSVYLYEFETQKKQKLLDLSIADFFLWSPDGRSLTLVGAEPGSSLQVLAVNAGTGEIIYRQGYDWQMSGMTAGSPVRSLGGLFLPHTPGLEDCSLPGKVQ